MSETKENQATDEVEEVLTGAALVKHNAVARADTILKAKAKIEKKLETMPDDPRCEGWKRRLSDYEKSLAVLEFTIRSGRYITLKTGEEPGEDDISIDVPVGGLALQG